LVKKGIELNSLNNGHLPPEIGICLLETRSLLERREPAEEIAILPLKRELEGT
jgi:hypothetical protein